MQRESVTIVKEFVPDDGGSTEPTTPLVVEQPMEEPLPSPVITPPVVHVGKPVTAQNMSTLVAIDLGRFVPETGRINFLTSIKEASGRDEILSVCVVLIHPSLSTVDTSFARADQVGVSTLRAVCNVLEDQQRVRVKSICCVGMGLGSRIGVGFVSLFTWRRSLLHQTEYFDNLEGLLYEHYSLDLLREIPFTTPPNPMEINQQVPHEVPLTRACSEVAVPCMAQTNAMFAKLFGSVGPMINLLKPKKNTDSEEAPAAPRIETEGLVFGQSFKDMRRVSEINLENRVPYFVEEIIRQLRVRKCVNEEGLFRRSARQGYVNALADRADAGEGREDDEDMPWSSFFLTVHPDIDVDVHVLAALLKLWFRRLPNPAFAPPVDRSGLDEHPLIHEEDPKAALDYLRYEKGVDPLWLGAVIALLDLLADIEANHDNNLMSADNLAVCVASSLMCLPEMEEALDPMASVRINKLSRGLVRCLIIGWYEGVRDIFVSELTERNSVISIYSDKARRQLDKVSWEYANNPKEVERLRPSTSTSIFSGRSRTTSTNSSVREPLLAHSTRNDFYGTTNMPLPGAVQT
eukprot:Clim_evm25s203 gene=Clim_evmTU25s203